MNNLQLSKQMAYALRHHPDEFNIRLDAEGWVPLDEFAQAMKVTVAEVESVVQNDPKQRYTIRNHRIRAAQGHSVRIRMSFDEVTPPPILWHGTVEQFLPSILEQGLLPMQRQYVHLSESREVATQVAKRRAGQVVILKINTTALLGHTDVMRAENGVWLAEKVPTNCFALA